MASAQSCHITSLQRNIRAEAPELESTPFLMLYHRLPFDNCPLLLPALIDLWPPAASQALHLATVGVNLTSIYAFKFSVTLSSSNGVALNGLHWCACHWDGCPCRRWPGLLSYTRVGWNGWAAELTATLRGITQ